MHHQDTRHLIFGQTIFQSVLERLITEEGERVLEDAPVIAIRGLNTGFVAGTAEPPDWNEKGGFSSLHAAYFAYSEDDAEELSEKHSQPTQDKPEKPAHLERLRLAEVARDLDLNASDTLETLARKRRTFAQENHPDLIPPEWRESANIRMKLANLLIDEAMKALQR